MSAVTLAPMTRENLPAIAAIERECFTVAWSEEMFADMLDNPSALFYTAHIENHILCGFAGMYLIAGEGQILNIAVSERFRRRGIARTLLSRLLDDCRTAGAERVLLEVRESNLPAQALYESFGFGFCGKRKRYYTHPTEDALVLLLTL